LICAATSSLECQLSPRQTENLVVLGKVWGFAKYHHPAITNGTVDWDAELLRVMPSVLAANSQAAATTAISKWLGELGPPPACNPCATIPESLAIRPDVGWISDAQTLGQALSAQLGAIYRNRSVSDTQRYVKLMPGVGNPIFGDEKPYPETPLPDPGLRLVGLFRFWNIIDYWYPYRDLIHGKWDDVLREFVPKVWAASDSTSYRLVMMTLVARINDGHANLWSAIRLRPPAGSWYVPVKTRFVEGRVVVSGYLDSIRGPATGLRVGDVILAVDGARVDSLIKAWTPYYGASNRAARLREISAALTRGGPGEVRLTIDRDGSVIKVLAARMSLSEADLMAMLPHDRPGATFQVLSPEVAYLKLSSVSGREISDYLKAATGTKVLVIDIRNYPKSFVVFSLGGHLVSQQTPFARFTYGQLSNPGAFAWTESVDLRPAPPTYNGKIVILVDESSQSQAEYTTMAFRSAAGAIVVGSTTAGADGNVSPIPLPGGLSAMITGIGVFYPDRRPTQQIGIVPDLVVRPTIAGIREGRDEVLEAAVSHALGRPFRLPH
jgi:C-terminal processing protease CtpA/Prc